MDDYEPESSGRAGGGRRLTAYGLRPTAPRRESGKKRAGRESAGGFHLGRGLLLELDVRLFAVLEVLDKGVYVAGLEALGFESDVGTEVPSRHSNHFYHTDTPHALFRQQRLLRLEAEHGRHADRPAWTRIRAWLPGAQQ
jgi:hypothetical protein